MLLLSAWSTNGWLPSGHAMRMALDLGLNRALEKLADGPSEGKRSEGEERDLGEYALQVTICCSYVQFSGFRPNLALPVLVRPSVSILSARHLSRKTDAQLG